MPFPATHPALERALLARGYAEPTPVQSAVLDDMLRGRDLLVSAQTGSGKTVAYGLSFVHQLLGDAERLDTPGAPLALVIAPTRELAIQVQGELAWLYAPAGARIVACIGGTDARQEARQLRAGCHIVVGTPGRLGDHLRRGQLNLASLRVVVLDEADEMLDMGFRDELEAVLDATPPSRRTLLFSATIARDIATLARRYQHDAARIDTLARKPHSDIEYRAVMTTGHEIEAAVVNVLRFFEAPTAIVFCATREGVRAMQDRLQARGFSSVALSGELSQAERTRGMQALRDGRARVCIATDVAARGLDLPQLDLVIHADLPMNGPLLLHRSGRTGRAGRKGVCVMIVASSKRRRAEQLIMQAGVQARWSGAPSAAEILARDAARLHDHDLLTTPADPAELESAQALLATHSPEQLATALIRMQRERLPEPEAVREMQVQASGAEPRATHPRAARGPYVPEANGSGDMVWFSMNVGRQSKADPKWLVPLICRMGDVKKRDIGSIKISQQETAFEIRRDMAQNFAASIRTSPRGDVQIRTLELAA